jgi:LuxR family quorum-sensing transcriptional regulator LasR
VADSKPDKAFARDALRNIPELSCLRDFIFESSLKFMTLTSREEIPIALTHRELECIKWSATGKSSWDIGQILNCTESTVNFHFTNIRRKFRTSSRRQAIVKAIRMGIITP